MLHKQSSPMVGVYMPHNIMGIFKINQEKKLHKLSYIFRYLYWLEELLMTQERVRNNHGKWAIGCQAFFLLFIKYSTYSYICSYWKNSLGTQEQIQINHGKRAIGCRAIELLLYKKNVNR